MRDHIGFSAVHTLAIHQVCADDNAGVNQIGIYAGEGSRYFPLEKNRVDLHQPAFRHNAFQGIA